MINFFGSFVIHEVDKSWVSFLLAEKIMLAQIVILLRSVAKPPQSEESLKPKKRESKAKSVLLFLPFCNKFYYKKKKYELNQQESKTYTNPRPIEHFRDSSLWSE